MSGERRLWRVPVEYGTGWTGERIEYVYAADRDEAAREAEANVEEEIPGTDVFADVDRIEEARITRGKVQA